MSLGVLVALTDLIQQKAFMECPQCHFRYQIRREPRSSMLYSKTNVARRYTYFWSGHLKAHLAAVHVPSILDTLYHPRLHPTLSSHSFDHLAQITVPLPAHQCWHTFRSFWRRVYRSRRRCRHRRRKRCPCVGHSSCCC